MPNTAEAIQVLPSASRLVHSLRDLGYDFPQAVADVVDNSVAADATQITIDLRFDGPDSWLRIADNGTGMDGEAVTEAMRYGARQSYDDEALGKFGLGLKTASLSQCRQLSVASRKAPERVRIVARKLDLDHVMRTDRWEILGLDPGGCDDRLVEPLQRGPGTVVLWQSLDRVLGYKIPTGGRARWAVDNLAEQLRLHLGMIFHRFIAGQVEGRRPLRIKLNGLPVTPWDPFARDEPATTALPASDIDVVTSEGVGLVRFQPFVLPPRERFSSEEAFQRYSGPRKWNAQQGFYIYRANRMIQSGGWSRMRALDEHVKLARASIDFFPELDSAFEVDVAKVRAVLPAALRERLHAPVEGLVRTAQSVYRAHPANDGVAPRRVIPATPKPQVRSLASVRRALEGAAREAGELSALRRIVRQLRKCEPDITRQFGW
jgi:hypothetical protein